MIPRIRQSGKKRFTKGPAIPLGNARLRKPLFMVVLQMVRRNPWLRQYYERLRAAGKPGKVAIIAAMRKFADRGLERGYSPQTLRADNAGLSLKQK